MKNSLSKLIAVLTLASVSSCVLDNMDYSNRACGSDHPCPNQQICVERTISPIQSTSFCVAADEAFTCMSGELYCGFNDHGTWLERCLPSEHGTEFLESCEGNTACKPPIAVCASPCESELDCSAEFTCDLSLHLCLPKTNCEAHQCEPNGRVCIKKVCCMVPTRAPTSAEGVPDCDCYLSASTNPALSPITCNLQGRVHLIPMSLNNPKDTPGLSIWIYDAEDRYTPLQKGNVFAADWDDGNGHYEFADLPSNREYIVQIQAGTSGKNVEVVTTTHFGYTLRAERCDADGSATQAFGALTLSNYMRFSENTPPDLGFLMGRIVDCSSASSTMGECAASLGVFQPQSGRQYYFPDEAILTPDSSSPPLQATSNKGYYAFTRLRPIENRVVFTATINSTLVVLDSVDLWILPEAASIVHPRIPENRLP